MYFLSLQGEKRTGGKWEESGRERDAENSLKGGNGEHKEKERQERGKDDEGRNSQERGRLWM